MIVIKLSGGDVIGIDNDSGEEIEVRQYHRDFNGGEDLTEDDSGRYLVTYPEPEPEPEPESTKQAAIREAWRQYPEATDTGAEE